MTKRIPHLAGAAMAAAFFISLAALRSAEAPASPEAVRAQALVGSPQFQAAVASFDRTYEQFVADLVTLTEIPAPPFMEKIRGEAYAKMLTAAGLEGVTTDPEGNVLAIRRGQNPAHPLLAIAAHLDTVFPEGTNVKVKRAGTTLRAPGIGDDTRNLAFVLAVLRALRDAKIETAGDILFIGNVGEEGPGDLRGVRYLFNQSAWKGRIARFITVDGGNNDIVTNAGLGSLRYKVTFTGPGGHSWGAFGLVSPAFAMGDAIARLGRLQVAKEPKVAYNVGVVSGGTSVNSIPFETSMEVDMRAVDPAALKDIDARFKQCVADAVAAENAARSTANGKIVAVLKLTGERPSGTTPADHPVLKQVAATMAAYRKVPVWNTGSTDANIPISLGIPAFSMSAQAGSTGGRAHSLDEWTDVEKKITVDGFALGLAVVLTVADAP